jgi:hypothetical protein
MRSDDTETQKDEADGQRENTAIKATAAVILFTFEASFA